MSEEKKIIELNDEELNQVSGGMVPKRKSSPYKEKNSREKPTPEFVICPNCGAQILPRCSCPNCGYPDSE